jgi:hypothetical protein
MPLGRIGLLIAALVLAVSAVAEGQVTREEFEVLKSEVNALKESLKTQNDLFRQVLGARRGEAPFKETLIAVDDAAVYGKAVRR